MAKVLNPALLGGLIEKYRAGMILYLDKESLVWFEEDLMSPTLEMFSDLEGIEFGALYLDCLVDKDCIGSQIVSDSKYIYFPIDNQKATDVTGMDSDDYLFRYIYEPMFDDLHRINPKEVWYMDTECTLEPKYYIRFDPIEYCESDINHCFRFVIYMDDKFFDYLVDDTDLDWMKRCNYPYIGFVCSQYTEFAKYAVKETKRYIRENLLQDLQGQCQASALLGDTYFQKIRENKTEKNYVVRNYLARIENKEKVRWHEVYNNLLIALNWSLLCLSAILQFSERIDGQTL